MAKALIPERGVYAITAIDGRAYVGGSVNISHRWRGHRSKLRLGKHENSRLQSAWTLLGESAFSFTVLERVPTDSEIYPAEQRHIDRLKAHASGFNIYPTAGSPIGSAHSDKTRKKMSASQTGLSAGEKNGRSKITAEAVVEIRRLSALGLSKQSIADAFNLSRQGVSFIVTRRRWGHVAG